MGFTVTQTEPQRHWHTLPQLHTLRKSKSKFWDNRQTRGLEDQDRQSFRAGGDRMTHWQGFLWSAMSNTTHSTWPTRPALQMLRGRAVPPGPLTVHLWGFSPVCRRICTTSMYCALKGFCSRVQACQRHTNSFFSPWMCSLLMCCQEQAHGGVSLDTHPPDCT